MTTQVGAHHIAVGKRTGGARAISNKKRRILQARALLSFGKVALTTKPFVGALVELETSVASLSRSPVESEESEEGVSEICPHA